MCAVHRLSLKLAASPRPHGEASDPPPCGRGELEVSTGRKWIVRLLIVDAQVVAGIYFGDRRRDGVARQWKLSAS